MSVDNNAEQKSTKDEKAPIKKKYTSPTIRLTLTLKEPDEESCSVFNYNSLIVEEKRKRRLEREQHQVNGSVEEPEEDENDVKRLAQHFEEKYGGVSVKRKKKKRAPKFYNYTDLASGYDESDSFIDNSEAFDEALPDDMETAFGGYYVNTGQLELKKVEISEENSDLDEVRVGKRKNCVLKSDDDSSDDDVVKSDDEDSKIDGEDIESATKKLPDDINPDEAEPVENVENGVEITKPPSLEGSIDRAVKINGVIKKKKKYKKLRLRDDNQEEAPKQKKKTVTVKSMLEEKRTGENGDSAANGCSKPAEISFSSINDVIESVVNAARNHSEDSRDSTSSSSDTKSIDSRTSCETEKDSHTDEGVSIESTNVVSNVPNAGSSEQVKLPENLSSEVIELIARIKKSVQNAEPSGARSLFKSSVDSKSSINSKLLKLESQVRSMKSASRHALYEYLAQFLPCSKDTLMKRAKKLLIEEEERHVTEPLQKLKASVDKLMPSLLDSYNAACQKIAEEKNVNDLKNGDINEKKSIASKIPPMKFTWTTETRTYLRELVSCRVKCFQTLKPRKESVDDYVKKFLETKVKPLWPNGWMETSILLKESQFYPSSPKAKKNVSGSTSNGPVVGSSLALTTTTANIATATTTTSTSVKKSSQSSVPSSANNVNSSTSGAKAANYNYLTNPMALQALALQYPAHVSQTDVINTAASSTGIPYRPDLSMMPPLPPNNAKLSMEMMTQIALVNSQLSSHAPYSKSTSPPKKSTTPTSSHPTSRSTTPVSSAASAPASLPDKKKSTDTSSSKFNEMFKIESLINSNTKTKKEHSMLNHVSQYNKHYSHKQEKRKSQSKKDDNVPKRSSSNHSSGSNNTCKVDSNKSTSPCSVSLSSSSSVTTESSRKSGGRDQVLDLSPNKIKEDTKCDKSDHQPSSRTEAGPIPNNSVTAKDHNYWAGANSKEDMKDEMMQETSSQSKTSFSSSESKNSVSASKAAPLSRKQRLLQESSRGFAQSPATVSFTHLKSLESAAKRSESHSSTSIKKNMKLLNADEKRDRLDEKPSNATDLLSMLISDSLQNQPSRLLPQFNTSFEKAKIESEMKTEERVKSPADFLLRPSSRDSLSSVGSFNAERRTPNNDHADIIQDLLTLNQIGNHSIPRRVDYQDSKKLNDFSNGSMISQSSLNASDQKTSSFYPRMDISPFQHEFFKHINRSSREGNSSYNTNSKSQDNCSTSEHPSLEIDQSPTSTLTSAALKQGKSTVYDYQQSVIMPPASTRWYTPESKS